MFIKIALIQFVICFSHIVLFGLRSKQTPTKYYLYITIFITIILFIYICFIIVFYSLTHHYLSTFTPCKMLWDFIYLNLLPINWEIYFYNTLKCIFIVSSLNKTIWNFIKFNKLLLFLSFTQIRHNHVNRS